MTARIRNTHTPLAGTLSAAEDNKRYYEDLFLKPAVTAALGAAAARMSIFSSDSKVRVGSYEVPITAAAFLGLYLAGVTGEFFAMKVLPHISRDDKWNQGVATGLLQPAAVGAANLGVWTLAVGSSGVSEKGVAQFAGIGALSEVVGDYVYNHFVVPALK